MPKTRPQSSLLYVGSYCEADQAGIHLCAFDPHSGALELRDSFQAGPNPSFLALHPDGRTLYAVNELRTPDGRTGGAVCAFGVQPASGGLALLNRQSSHGGDPCYLTLDQSGRFLLVANYASATLAVFPLGKDGQLQPASQVVQQHGHGPHPLRQEDPHAHAIRLSADNAFALSCDLGSDRVFVYSFDPATGKLSEHGKVIFPPGAGPRHLAFHPSRSLIYVVNELDATIAVFDYAAESGTLTGLQTLSVLPPDFHGTNLAAEIAVHPNGKFVYASNRGHDSLAIFGVDEKSGLLSPLGHAPTRGQTPRHFAIHPDGQFLLVANQASSSLTVFRIDTESGGLTYLSEISLPRPVYLKFADANT